MGPGPQRPAAGAALASLLRGLPDRRGPLDPPPLLRGVRGLPVPDLADAGSTIPGLHLHGLDRLRTTGGHNHDLHVKDALLSVGVSRDIVMHLPDRSMTDLLETPPDTRAVQRRLLGSGPSTIGEVAAALGIGSTEASARMAWLADRGFVTELAGGIGGLGGEPRWQTALRAHGTRASGRVADLLDTL